MTNFTSPDSPLPDLESFTSLPQWLLIPFTIISIAECILGTVGNTLVIIVISCIEKSNISHGPYNCFIVNLALSDLVLCLFTMPLNTYRSLNIYMTFPPAFCKLADSFPAINVCVSSLTIVAISVHRYLVVCYPHKQLIGGSLTFLIMIGIWIIAIVAASPLFIYSLSSQVYDDGFLKTMVTLFCNEPTNDLCEEKYYNKYGRLHVCHESWPKHADWRLLYTIFMFFLQFILPISIICITYYQVMLKLKERSRYRFLIKRHNVALSRLEVRRQRRNNILLLLIVTSYIISWLPFNISYTVFTHLNQYQNTTETTPTQQGGKVTDLSKYLPLRFLICMISAVANPFLYGYFNETFKDGLEKIFSTFCPRSTRSINQIYYDQNNSPALELKSRKCSNDDLPIQSNSYGLTSQEYSTSSCSRPQSTCLTTNSTNHLLTSFSSTN